MFSVRWGADHEVRRGLLFSTVMIREAYSDKNAILQTRLALMNELRRHDNPRVADIADMDEPVKRQISRHQHPLL